MKESNQKPVLRLRSGLALSRVEVPATSNQKGKVIAVSISERKGTRKRNTALVKLKKDLGIIGDAHAGDRHRQISLLSIESIEKIRAKGINVEPGDFAENITTQGLDLLSLKLGTKIKIDRNAMLEITQIGKDCHTRCNIYYQAGDCIMPKEGIFARVLKGGIIKPTDNIEVIDNV